MKFGARQIVLARVIAKNHPKEFLRLWHPRTHQGYGIMVNAETIGPFAPCYKLLHDFRSQTNECHPLAHSSGLPLSLDYVARSRIDGKHLPQHAYTADLTFIFSLL